MTIKPKDFYEMPQLNLPSDIDWNQPLQGEPVYMMVDVSSKEDLILIKVSRDGRSLSINHAKDATESELIETVTSIKNYLEAWLSS